MEMMLSTELAWKAGNPHVSIQLDSDEDERSVRSVAFDYANMIQDTFPILFAAATDCESNCLNACKFPRWKFVE